jgi:hypothetical protein
MLHTVVESWVAQQATALGRIGSEPGLEKITCTQLPARPGVGQQLHVRAYSNAAAREGGLDVGAVVSGG